jgi:hypothetical protein
MADSKRWVVIALSPIAQALAPDELVGKLSEALAGIEIFVPAHVEHHEGENVTVQLVEGYAFARFTEPDRTYMKLASGLLGAPLKVPGNRTLATVTNAEVDKLRAQLVQEAHDEVRTGDSVLIETGLYSQMEGVVVAVLPEDRLEILVKLRSKQSLVTLPRVFVSVIDQHPLGEVQGRLNKLCAYIRQLKQLLNVPLDLGPLRRAFVDLQACQRYASASRQCLIEQRLEALAEQAKSLSLSGEELTVLATLASRARVPTQLERAFSAKHGLSVRVAGVGQNVEQLGALVDLCKRQQTHTQGLRSLAHRIRRCGGEDAADAVVFDGQDLASRCTSLQQVLSELRLLRGRFPTARFFVAFDDGYERRRAHYGGYALETVGHSPLITQKTVRELFEALGIRELAAPGAEARDIIGSYVRKAESEGQHLVIHSASLSLLALATETTRVFAMRPGNRKPLMFDAKEVTTRLGVPPEKVATLLALIGTGAGVVGGIARVPKRKLTELVARYASLDEIYAQGIVKLSESFYQQFQEAEARVRLNQLLLGFYAEPSRVVLHEPDLAAVSTLLRRPEGDLKLCLDEEAA